MIDDPLWAAIKAAHERWSPGSSERFPPAPEWELAAGNLGTEEDEPDQALSLPVPSVPAVPGVIEEYGRPARAEPGAEECIDWEERAGVLEYEGGLSRAEAERLALAEVSAFPHTTRRGEPPKRHYGRGGRLLPGWWLPRA